MDKQNNHNKKGGKMADKHSLKKLTDKEVVGLKGKLLEVRRIGAQPIFIKVTSKDSVKDALTKADIPTDSDIKVEGMKAKSSNWQTITLKDRVSGFVRIAVTTKVKGA
jgi:hypothetical protein